MTPDLNSVVNASLLCAACFICTLIMPAEACEGQAQLRCMT